MKWLVTAFAPFAGAESNSSLIVAQALARQDWGGRVDFQFPLPVTFKDALSSIGNIENYEGILALGQAEGRARISLERVALNFADASVGDNAGYRPEEVKLAAAGPDLHWCPIPWPKFTRPANVELSYSAGTFVCNALFYQLLAARKFAGFVHIPLLDSQKEFPAPQARMASVDAVASLKLILEFLTAL